MISFGHGNEGGGLISAMPLEDFIDENTGLAEIAHRSAPEKSNQSSRWVPVAAATWFCCLSILYSLSSVSSDLGLVLPSAVPIILLVLLLFVLLAFGGVVLLSLALRYRAGTARRQGRRWVATMNVWMTSFSAVFFLVFAFVLAFWLGPTLRFALTGMCFGGLLGLLGLLLTRWESQPDGLFYTPSRWLALLVMLAIAARLVYGGWHTMHRGTTDEQHWFLSASGTQVSLAVAGALIGYYLVYAIGVRLRVVRHERRHP